MNEIIPAIIPYTFDELKDKLSLVSGISEIVQIDILDGVFTKEASWPYAKKDDPDFASIIREEEGMPYWEDFDFEFHLMIKNPDRHIQEWISLGAKRVIVHYESFPDLESFRTFAQHFRQEFGGDRSFLSIELGIALKLETPASVLTEVIADIDFVQFMGIGEIGRQGIPFDESVISKIAEFRQRYADMPISIDGGVSLENIQMLSEAGADRFVVGGAIFGSNNILDTIEELETLADNG